MKTILTSFMVLLMVIVGVSLARPQGFGDQLFGGFHHPHGHNSASAGGFGQGTVQNHVATGTGIGQANAGPDGFGIGLGIGGAIVSPIGSETFGTGSSIATGKK